MISLSAEAEKINDALADADEEEQEVGEFRCENLEVWGLDERLIRLRRAQLAREEGMRVGW